MYFKSLQQTKSLKLINMKYFIYKYTVYRKKNYDSKLYIVYCQYT